MVKINEVFLNYKEENRPLLCHVCKIQSSYTYLKWTDINLTLQVCYMWLLGPSVKVVYL